MGVEYKIGCDPSAVSQFDEFLRRQPFFDSYDAELSLYNLRIPDLTKIEDFPDAYVVIKADGLYFCDNLTSPDSAARILRCLIDQALLHSQRITIEEP
jgi:hypothetical protein